MFEFDHLAISCETLPAGAEAVEAALGVRLGPGGQHPDFGTHNRLLSLGGTEYLEVIAVDPSAPPPSRPRWFDLDAFSGPPRLTNWILRCADMEAALAALGDGTGTPIALSRGVYRWSMAVPLDGRLPFDNIHPAVIQWQSDHPAASLEPSGCRLTELVIRHPEAATLRDRLRLTDPRFRFETGPAGLEAVIDTPAGPRRLC
ncbi:VOC family protein [Aliiruegeria sabulilitoris]|uniref:VOC family protein n=1 Tax=Aliiruegeria sabulilitoris TaxID=1510458 RepID=UPI000831EC44|nr:VOC family protein [Aliiruegeria sabulilitoris]NDR56013.1 VOC family protein [Pseudoruegeria sp. M32A2M]